ncbi:MFS transporter [Teichococcus vastitatis]|uniref:MFS transporter n=1 Tax=Teichococcus vastitatis TaxID=2307076 RepID=A0ABS9WD12_9PROT|nr:MFS transporter [Pseudoroseomonas vastitatis]MCI0757151.1 MFS transporter [Pseudoroseomonas vastitatis]
MRPPLIASAGWRSATVFVLYAYQGLVAGFAVTALPNHFAALGANASEVGAHVAMVGLPWILQPLWGPVVDRFGGFRMGRRRFWIVAGILLSLLALTRLLLVEEAGRHDLPALSLVFLAHSALASLTDTATDGMIIDHVPAGRLGIANATTRAGFVTGISLGAAGFGWLLARHGLQAASAVLLAIGTLALVLPLLVREAPGDAWLSLRQRPLARPSGLGRLLRGLGRSLAQPRMMLLLAFCFAVDLAAAAFRVPLAVELVQRLGWTAEALSGFQGLAGFLAGTAGALAIGWWTDRTGAPRALTILLACSALSHGAAGLMLGQMMGGGAGVAGPLALALSTVTPALVFVALAPAVMQASRGEAAATRFALFMAALNMGDVAGASLSGFLVEQLGLPLLGLAAAAMFLGGAAVVRFGLPGPRPTA